MVSEQNCAKVARIFKSTPRRAYQELPPQHTGRHDASLQNRCRDWPGRKELADWRAKLVFDEEMKEHSMTSGSSRFLVTEISTISRHLTA